MATKCIVNKSTMTGIADAIRTKGGASSPLLPSQMAAAIAAIPTGGGEIVEAPFNDVNFYDHLGRIRHSYTMSEIAELTELPPLPDHKSDGMTSQGWNHTLDEIKNAGHHLEVGEIVAPSDGATHIIVDVANWKRATLRLTASKADDTTVDWGDGTIDRVATTSATSVVHTYAKSGKFEIVIASSTGTVNLGVSGSTSIFEQDAFRYAVKEFYGGRNILRYLSGFSAYTGLLACTIANETVFADLNFLYNTSIIHFATSRNLAHGYSFLYLIYGIKSISLAPRNESFPMQLLHSSGALKRLVLPIGTTIVQTGLINGNNYSLIDIVLPDSVTTLQTGFGVFRSLEKIIFPKKINKLTSNPFPSEMINGGVLDFTKCEVVPTLNVTFTVPSGGVIIVPDELYDEWTTATNWTAIASSIVKKSDYQGE